LTIKGVIHIIEAFKEGFLCFYAGEKGDMNQELLTEVKERLSRVSATICELRGYL
jgi:hypothetical protein